ncbi:MAG: sensor hybrid histidine kinase, partial [Marmoricola sp.]|nr:sensor hybrid histidine kinase [Marmoricola sp.]
MKDARHVPTPSQRAPERVLLETALPAQTGHGEVAVDPALAEDAERYRSLFTHTPNAAFSLDLEGRYVDANPAARVLCGYDLPDLEQMSFTDVICPEDLPEVAAAFLEVVQGCPRQLDAHTRHRDGRRLDVRITAVPVVVAGAVVGVHGIAEDVTEANRMRRELESARRTAELALAAKSLFLANMSHEVRTPLTSVLAATEMLDDLGLEDPAGHLVAMIGRSGERLLRLVGDLLDFSQLERSGLELVEEELGLRRVLAETVAPLEQEAATRGLELVSTVETNVPDRWWGDAFRISQVLTNLLQNAVKFTEEGGVRLVVT